MYEKCEISSARAAELNAPVCAARACTDAYRLKNPFAFLRVCVTGRVRLAGMGRKSVLPAIADQKIEVQAAEVLARASYGLCTRVAHVHQGQFLL